jgi:hypothetical protein
MFIVLSSSSSHTCMRVLQVLYPGKLGKYLGAWDWGMDGASALYRALYPQVCFVCAFPWHFVCSLTTLMVRRGPSTISPRSVFSLCATK